MDDERFLKVCRSNAQKRKEKKLDYIKRQNVSAPNNHDRGAYSGRGRQIQMPPLRDSVSDRERQRLVLVGFFAGLGLTAFTFLVLIWCYLIPYMQGAFS